MIQPSPEKPTFQEVSFMFISEVPDHIEGSPSLPNYVGMYALFGCIGGIRPYPLAVDVADMALAKLLAEARVDLQESNIGTYGYTDDVYINCPDGSNVRIYYGRTRDE